MTDCCLLSQVASFVACVLPLLVTSKITEPANMIEETVEALWLKISCSAE